MKPLQLKQQVESVQFRPLQPDIQDDQGRPPLADFCQRCVAVVSQAGFKSLILQDAGDQLAEIDDASRLADAVAAQLTTKVSDKQSLLTETDPLKRLEMVFSIMEGELGVLQVERKIRGRVKRQMEKTQREYYLNEQMKAIQSELGGEGEEVNEIAELQGRQVASQSRLAHLTIKAPITGTVYQLSVHTEGGVIAANEPLMMILPEHDDLVLQAQLTNGQTVPIRLGRDFLIDGELAAMMGRVPGVTNVELKAQEAPRLALVS